MSTIIKQKIEEILSLSSKMLGVSQKNTNLIKYNHPDCLVADNQNSKCDLVQKIFKKTLECNAMMQIIKNSAEDCLNSDDFDSCAGIPMYHFVTFSEPHYKCTKAEAILYEALKNYPTMIEIITEQTLAQENYTFFDR